MFSEKFRALRLALLLIIICFSSQAYGAVYDKLYSLSAVELLRQGDNARARTGRIDNDTSIICYSIASSRYNPELNKREKTAVAEACMRLYYIQRQHFGDLSRGIKLLRTAGKIYDEIGGDKPRVALGMGAVYQMMANSSDAPAYNGIALRTYTDGLKEAMRSSGNAVTDTLALCVLNVSQAIGRLDSVAPVLGEYMRSVGNSNNVLSRYNRMLYDIFKATEVNQYAAALQKCDSAYNWLAGKDAWRYAAYTLANKAQILTKTGHSDIALENLLAANELVKKYNLRDFKKPLWEMIVRTARATGREELARSFEEQLSTLQDNDTRHQQLMNIIDAENAMQEEHFTQQMAESRVREARWRAIVVALVAIAALIALFSVVLVRKNRSLRRAHRVLYDNIQKSLEAESPRQPHSSDTHEGSVPESQHTASDNEQKESTCEEEKILVRVKEVLENTQQIYSPDFSVEDLAALLGMKVRPLSHAINATTGENFSTLLGRQRIREACRRISGGEYENLTVEAIAAGVGFKSRSHFTLLFKRFAGMLPSEYYRMARQNK